MISKFSFLGVRLTTKTWNHGKSLFLGYKAEMHLCYDHYFNFWRVKYDINKNKLNLINLERSEALKRQLPATWSPIRLNHFDFDVILTVFQVFWSYILMLQYLLYVVFVEFPWFLSFRIWVGAAKWKPRNHGKSVFLGLQSLNACGSIFRSLFQLSEC